MALPEAAAGPLLIGTVSGTASGAAGDAAAEGGDSAISAPTIRCRPTRRASACARTTPAREH